MTRALTKTHHLSIVVPAFNEEGNIESLYLGLLDELSQVDMTWEIIFIDDGSIDNTWSVITALHNADNRVKGIRLSRNFGHQHALLAGLKNTTGSLIITMDADLQHPPDLIPELVAEWRKGSKIVNTIRIDHSDLSLFKKITSRAFYAIFSLMSGVGLEKGMADFRLFDRKVLNDILKFREEGLFLRGVVQWVGYPSSSITFRSAARFTGSSKYKFRNMLKFAWRGISSFSLMPLRVGILLGLTASGLSFLGVLYAIYGKLIAGTAVPGWASTVAIISFLFGILFLYLGLLGEYIGRVVTEVRQRPRFLVSEWLGFDEKTATKDMVNLANSP